MRRIALLAVDLSRIMDRIAGVCMTLIMLMITGNILSRAIFDRPLLGSYEYVGLITTVMFSLALAYCAAQGGHIAVGFIVERFPQRVQGVVEVFVNTVAMLFWGVVAWHVLLFAKSKAVNNVVSSTTQTPVYPFIIILALGLFVLCVVLLAKLIESAKKVIGDK